MDTTDEIKGKIIAYLKEMNGSEIHGKQLANRIHTSISACRHVAEGLVNSGAIRKVQTSRCTAFYYIPTDSMLAAEKSHQARTRLVGTLKPRPEKAALIARIRAEREAIPSIL